MQPTVNDGKPPEPALTTCAKCGRTGRDGVKGWMLSDGPLLCLECYVRLDPERN